MFSNCKIVSESIRKKTYNVMFCDLGNLLGDGNTTIVMRVFGFKEYYSKTKEDYSFLFFRYNSGLECYIHPDYIIPSGSTDMVSFYFTCLPESEFVLQDKSWINYVSVTKTVIGILLKPHA